VFETEEEVVGGGREWNRRMAERIRKVKMMGGAMHEWQVTWGEEGTIDARVSISLPSQSRVCLLMRRIPFPPHSSGTYLSTFYPDKGRIYSYLGWYE
jgi:hypothetical protein